MAALLVGGCIPIPAALPPAKGSIGVGAAIGNPTPDPDDGTPLTEAEPIVTGRIGLEIQSLFRQQFRRPVELEAGYTYQIFTNSLRQARNRHGVYFGASILGGHWAFAGVWRLRLTVRGYAEYLRMQAFEGDGWGGGWAIGLEAATFEEHDGDQGQGLRFIGAYTGEWSIGGELFGGVYSVGEGEYGIVGLAVTVRWPAMAGILVIPLSGRF